MPPKVRIKREDVIRAALGEVKRAGPEALNARSIARALGCSTQPVFSNFATMDELKKELVDEAYAVFGSYTERERESGKYPPYKALGMAYIRFADEEKELFRLLFMRERETDAEESENEKKNFGDGAALAAKAAGLTEEEAKLFQLEMWSFVHGLGAMAATGYTVIDEGLVSAMLTDAYLGLRARFAEKHEENSEGKQKEG